jgi:hypothetical protein
LGRRASVSLTPATGARTTRFCRTQPPVVALRLRRALVPVVCTLCSLTDQSPPCKHDNAHDTAASTASRPTFVTMANAPPPGRDGGRCRSDLGWKRRGIFSYGGLDSQIADLPDGQISRRIDAAEFVIASEAKQSIKPGKKNGLLRFARNDGKTLGPHPEERALFARVSKDGRGSVRYIHPSRRLLRKLLRMRPVFILPLSSAANEIQSRHGRA